MEVSDALSVHQRIRNNQLIKITKLKHLDIENVGWGSKGKLLVDAIKKSTSLTALGFHLDESELIYLLNDVLPHHPTIRSVTIAGDHISKPTDVVVKMVQKSHWTELKVAMDQISRHQKDALLNICAGVRLNQTITTLDLSKCQIGESVVRSLANVFEENNTITSLFIEVVSDVDLTPLSSVLEKKRQLAAFGILGAIDDDETWRNLSRALRANSSLTHLELYPEVSEGGAREIIELLRNNQLKSLSADLYEEDVDLIYEELLSNKSLTSLDLGTSIYSNAGLLSEVVKVHPALQRLSTNISSFQTEELKQLSAALSQNTTLTDIKIGSDANRAIWQEFKGVFQHNKTLRHLTVSCSTMHEDDWSHLAQVLSGSDSIKSFTCENIPDAEFNVLCQGLKLNKSLTDVTFRVRHDLKEELEVLFNALKGNTTLVSLTIDGRTTNFSKFHASTLFNDLNLESLDITACWGDQHFIQTLDQLSFERKVERRTEVTNLVVSLFNIARRPESFELFPREIWEAIFSRIHTAHLHVGEAAEAIFDDSTLRKIVHFDSGKPSDRTLFCHWT